MCQWWSRYDLGGTPAVRTTEGTCYANAGKRVMRRDDGTLRLEVLGSAEYDAPRRDGEAWPHLLVQQDFDPAPVVGAMSSLTLSMNLRVAYCRNAMESGYDEALHTAQAPFYLHLRNTNRSSEDYGKALWGRYPDIRLPLRASCRDGERTLGYGYRDIYLYRAAAQHLGRHIVPRRQVACRVS